MKSQTPLGKISDDLTEFNKSLESPSAMINGKFINMSMNLDEIKSWIRGTRCIDYAHQDQDSSGNLWEERIYQKDGKLYSIQFLNDYPSEKWGGNGYIRGEYEIKEVIRHEKPVTITQITYIPVDET